MSWKEVGGTSSNPQLRMKRYDGSSTWTIVDGNASTGLNYVEGHTPYRHSSVVYNSKLHLFWGESRGTDSRYYLRMKTYDGSSWTTNSLDWNRKTRSYVGPSDPDAVTYNNKLYVTWNEQDTIIKKRQIRVTKHDGTTRTFIDGDGDYGLNYNSARATEASTIQEINGDLYVVWQEDYDGTLNAGQIRAKKYPLEAIATSVTLPADDTYITGNILTFSVTFNKTLTVSGGTPYVPITLATGGTVNAGYYSGSGTTTLVFRYLVVSGNYDSDGISLGASIVLPSGCTLADASSVSADLTLNNVASTTGILVDAIAPTVSSINRQTPATTPTNASSLVYRVTFSETVTGVGTSDFALTTSGGATGGTIASVAIVSGNTYDVTVNTLLGYGTFRLDLNSSGTGIADTPGNLISGGYISGQTYTNTKMATLTTKPITAIGSTNATGNLNISDLGYPNPTYGVCWGASADPTISGDKVTTGTASATGDLTSSITGLTPGTTYHLRAFATNNAGTGYGTDVTFTTTATMTEPGNALNFDGTDDYVVATDNNNSLTAFTIEAWVKWTPTTTSDVQFICGKEVAQMELHTGGGAGANGIRFIPTTGVYLDAANVLPVGVWTHVAAVYNPSVSLAKMYINGEEVTLVPNGATLSTLIVNTATPFYLGSRSDASYRFKGSMDEVRVWNLVRSQSEIQADMDNAISASSTGLINYYNFNEGTAGDNNTAGSTILPDLTSNANNGTLTNLALTGTTSNWVESYAMVVPISTAATGTTVSGFTANWSAPATGSVNNYKLYVATDAAFSSMVAGYNPLTIASTSTTTAVTGLAANTAYYYRVCADKTTVTGEGARSNTITATTAHVAPVATTVAATSITTTGATLNGTINANNASTAVTFQYGLTTSYGSTVTAAQSPVTGILATSVSYALSGLVPNTTYHYRVVGVNTAGTTNGSDLTFSTLEPEVPVDLAVSNCTIATGDTCFDATNEITVSTVTVADNASANFIAGYSVTLLPGFHAVEGSYVHAWITEDASFCDAAGGSPIVEKPALKSVENQAVPKKQTINSGGKSIKVYPNPNNGKFTLELSNIESGAVVTIYNMLGVRVYHAKAVNETLHKINLNEIKKGIYVVNVTDGNKQVIRKMVVN